MVSEHLGLPIETPETSNAQLSNASRDASPANSISVDPQGDIPYRIAYQPNLRARNAIEQDESRNTSAEGSKRPSTSPVLRSLGPVPRDVDVEMTNTDSLRTSSFPNNGPLAPTEHSATASSASSVSDEFSIAPKLEYPEENMRIQSSFSVLPSDSNYRESQNEDFERGTHQIRVSKKGQMVHHTKQEFAEAGYFIEALKLKGMSWSKVADEYAHYFGVRRSRMALSNPQIPWRNLQRDRLLVLKIRGRARPREIPSTYTRPDLPLQLEYPRAEPVILDGPTQ